jgi:hypothetical protein
MMRVPWGVVLAWAVCGCSGEVGDEEPAREGEAQAITVAPTGRGAVAGAAVAPSRDLRGNGIDYHGGPVMLGSVNLYYIWYGSWSGNTATNILTDFARSLGGSPYWNINTTYYDGNATPLVNRVSFSGSTLDGYSRGKALSDAGVLGVVSDAVTSGRFPADPHGIYFVLTSADVDETSGFCTLYCGWHDHATVAGIDLKYSFVGNADRCLPACAAQRTSPNGNAGADAMASVIAHEAEEAATDPDLDAWFDAFGEENADKCAFTFGNTYAVGNGARANMRLGARDFLIQQNWVNARGGFCATHYP